MNMNKSEEIAEKIIKIILIIAGASLFFVLVSSFLPPSEEGGILETLKLILIIPIIMGAMIVVARRSDLMFLPILRMIGLILFVLWILSFFIDNPFRG